MLGPISSVFIYRLALRLSYRYITWMQPWVTLASNYKCKGRRPQVWLLLSESRREVVRAL